MSAAVASPRMIASMSPYDRDRARGVQAVGVVAAVGPLAIAVRAPAVGAVVQHDAAGVAVEPARVHLVVDDARADVGLGRAADAAAVRVHQLLLVELVPGREAVGHEVLRAGLEGERALLGGLALGAGREAKSWARCAAWAAIVWNAP